MQPMQMKRRTSFIEDKMRSWKEGKKRDLRSRLLLVATAALAGAGMYLSDYPAHMTVVQWFILAPMLYILFVRGLPLGWFMLAGFISAAVGNAHAFHLDMGLTAPLLMISYQAAWGIVIYAGLYALLRIFPRRFIVIILFPLLVVTAEFLGQVIFRMWGTAQSFSRVQTFWPPLIQIAAITGQAGVTYLVCLTNTFLAGLLVIRKERMDFRLSAVFFAVIMGLSAAYSIASFYIDKPKEFIKVAALGWGESGPVGSWEQRLKKIDYLIGTGKVDYRLIVYPEASLKIYFDEMVHFKYKLAEISRKHKIYQFAGFFDEHKKYNGIMSVDPEGNTRELYYKTHLVKFIEDYNAGTGSVGNVEVDGVTVGAMICQDDNFQDIARRNSAAGAQVIVVPTNDWKQVKDYHSENMLYRAVENRVVIVRAASQGISRIIDPRGVVVAESDPFFLGIGEGGESILTATVRLPRRGSVYSMVGNVFVYVCMAALVIGCIMGLMGVRKGKDSVA